MKRILLCLLCCTALQACKEERSYCWTCNYKYAGGKPDKTGDTLICNLRKTDIEIRQGKDFDGSAAGYNTWTISNCVKQ